MILWKWQNPPPFRIIRGLGRRGSESQEFLCCLLLTFHLQYHSFQLLWWDSATLPVLHHTVCQSISLHNFFIGNKNYSYLFIFIIWVDLGRKMQMVLVKWAGKTQCKFPNNQKQVFYSVNCATSGKSQSPQMLQITNKISNPSSLGISSCYLFVCFSLEMIPPAKCCFLNSCSFWQRALIREEKNIHWNKLPWGCLLSVKVYIMSLSLSEQK